MTLRLVGTLELFACPRCGGTGKEPCPETITANGDRARSGGFPVPCELCGGSKAVDRGKYMQFQDLARRAGLADTPSNQR